MDYYQKLISKLTSQRMKGMFGYSQYPQTQVQTAQPYQPFSQYRQQIQQQYLGTLSQRYPSIPFQSYGRQTIIPYQPTPTQPTYLTFIQAETWANSSVGKAFMAQHPEFPGFSQAYQAFQQQYQQYQPTDGLSRTPTPTEQRYTQALIPIPEVPGASYSDGSRRNVWYQGKLYPASDFWAMVGKGGIGYGQIRQTDLARR